jgi:phosphodiesterase/alkaline phosphatase D-like protein
MSKDKATLVAMTMTFTFLSLGSLAFTLLLLNYYPAYPQQKDNNDIDKVSSITDGIASGDVRDHSAILWSRANT